MSEEKRGLSNADMAAFVAELNKSKPKSEYAEPKFLVAAGVAVFAVFGFLTKDKEQVNDLQGQSLYQIVQKASGFEQQLASIENRLDKRAMPIAQIPAMVERVGANYKSLNDLRETVDKDIDALRQSIDAQLEGIQDDEDNEQNRREVELRNELFRSIEERDTRMATLMTELRDMRKMLFDHANTPPAEHSK